MSYDDDPADEADTRPAWACWILDAAALGGAALALGQEWDDAHGDPEFW